MLKKRYGRLIYFAVVLMAGIFVLVNADSGAQERRVLKVAFPELEGISETDQYGRRTGLVVDYLNEISKYTGWEYEYIGVGNEDLIPNFQEGKYDLMGGTFFLPGFEEYFAYPDYSAGRSRAVILCHQDDLSLRGYDITSLNGKTIGVYERATDKIRYLTEFLAGNNLDCQIRYYTYEEMADGNLYGRLRSGEVDMLLGNNLEIDGEFRMVASFQAQPYYIVTTVGNTEVLEGLNTALRCILESTPDFADKAYYSNFPDVKLSDIQLNDQELEYIGKKKTIKVAVVANGHPFYCKDSAAELHDGMLPELFENISTFTGLSFTYVYGNNYADCIRLVKQGEADIVGAYLSGEEMALDDNLALTQPFIYLNNIIMKHKQVSYPGTGLTCGILNGGDLPTGLGADNVRRYDNVTEMLKAVNSGDVDYIYGVSAMLEPELQNHRYLNVAPVTRERDSTEAAFAIAMPVEPELLTILNKAIGNISTEEKNTLLNQNLVSIGYSNITLQELVYANPVASILILAGILILIMTAVILNIRNRMKNALMQTRLEAAEARSLAKSSFLSQMSHEIRTPMNAIVGLANLTCMEQEVPPEIEKKLRKIHSSSKYLLALINDILDMSRIEYGKMEIVEKEFSLSHMLGELQDMMSSQTQQKGLEFQGEIHISHDWLSGDEIRLRQILTNLLSNAVKFTPAGGRVALCAEETSGGGETAEYRFSVRDTGIGIPPEDQERIFTSFEQLKPSVSCSAGTGLGLPISRSIARMMGGDLMVVSEPGKGSEFYVTLRFTLGTGVPPDSADGGQEQSLSGMKVLLAEDNDFNAEIAQELLAMQEVLVCRGANGQEAVDLFNASAPGEFQAILMDIQMPVKNGYQAAREIRASGRPDADVPIIAMTANTFREDEEAARAVGMTGFVPKPVDYQRLFGELRRSRC